MKYREIDAVHEEAMSDPEYAASYNRVVRRERLSQTFKKWRELAGLTPEELASKMGVSRSALSKLESGRSNPTYDTICSFADACELEKRGIDIIVYV